MHLVGTWVSARLCLLCFAMFGGWACCMKSLHLCMGAGFASGRRT